MTQTIQVNHPVISHLDHEPFWAVVGDGAASASLMASGGEYFARRRDMGGASPEEFFTRLDADPIGSLNHVLTSVTLTSQFLQQSKRRRDDMSALHTINVPISALSVAGSGELILAAMECSPSLRPSIEITEIRNPVTSNLFTQALRGLAPLQEAGIPILLDDFAGATDPRLPYLFHQASGIKLDGDMTTGILRSGFSSLPRSTQMVITQAAQSGKTIIAEAVQNNVNARVLSHLFVGVGNPMVQGRDLGKQKVISPVASSSSLALTASGPISVF